MADSAEQALDLIGAGRVTVAGGPALKAERLVRADSPVLVVRDRTNIRSLQPGDLGEPVDLVVADLSFISLRSVLPALLGLAREGASLVFLVKPQFEANRDDAARGQGVIRDPAVWRQVLIGIRDALAEHGAAIMGAMVSPIHGADGNVEFLVHARAMPGAAEIDVEALLRETGTS